MIRTATRSTVESLKEALGRSSLPYSRWARRNNLHPATIYAMLNERSVSVSKENEVRQALGLHPVRIEQIWINVEEQKIVNRQQPPPYKSMQIRVQPDVAEHVNRFVQRLGYRSFSDYALQHIIPDLVDAERSPDAVHINVNGPKSSAMEMER